MTLLKLVNEPKDYDWGSETLMSEVLGLSPTGKPMAEVWFGTHHNSPTRVESMSGKTLREKLKREIPFLVKFLAANQPLSIQVHPSKQKAKLEFQLGNPNYSDPNHKPEVLVAVTEFRALKGFRPPQDTYSDLELLAKADSELEGLKAAFQRGTYLEAMRWAFGSDSERVEKFVAATKVLTRTQHKLAQELNNLHPSDPGIIVAFLMNRVTLQPGEAIFVDAGEIHAYLSGLGVEVMAPSDNVLRGGLTKKNIDILELLSILSYEPSSGEIVRTKKIANGLSEYELPVQEFKLYKAEPSARRLLADLDLYGQDGIAVCTEGRVTFSTSSDEVLTISKGESVYLGYSRLFSISGSGTVYLALG